MKYRRNIQQDLDIEDYLGERVRIAYNLAQCSWDKPVLEGERCFSVRHGKGWKVQGYTDQLYLKDVEFRVSAATHQRVRRVKQREVYAFIVGTVAKMPKNARPEKWPEITFNPFKDDTFVLRDGRIPVESCTGAFFDGRTVRCGGAGLRRNGRRHSVNSSVKIREDFHDKPHSRQQRVSWEWPRDFFEVGDSEAVLYRSDKWQADGKKIDYKHVKEGPQKLLLRQDFVVDARGSRLRLDGMKLHGPYIDMQGEFPDSFAVLAESLGLQARLYANDEGTRYQDYVELRFAKGAKLGAGKFADGSTFVFVYDSTGPLAVVIGEELDVLKDGIVG